MFRKLDANVSFYQKALDGTAARHKAITSNLANVNTPNYKRKHVTFEDQLQDKINLKKGIDMRLTHKNHIDNKSKNFTPLTVTDSNNSYRIDGNGIDVDVESAELAKNTIMYNAIIKYISGDFEKIKNVIREGNR